MPVDFGSSRARVRVHPYEVMIDDRMNRFVCVCRVREAAAVFWLASRCVRPKPIHTFALCCLPRPHWVSTKKTKKNKTPLAQIITVTPSTVYPPPSSCVEALLAAGAALDAAADGGQTALFLASGAGRKYCVHILLRAGADRSCIATVYILLTAHVFEFKLSHFQIVQQTPHVSLISSLSGV